MSTYSEPFVSQIKAWIQNESLVHLSQETANAEYLGPVMVNKSTIEPNKPRYALYFNMIYQNFTAVY